MKRLVMIGVLALLSRGLLAQAPSEVRGRVLDAESGDPLSGADVSIGGFLVTSGWRNLLFGSVDPGRYELRVRRVGYSPNMRGIDVLPGLSQQIEIRLAAQPVELDTITVMAANSAGLTASGEFLRRRGSNLGQALDGWEGIAIRRGAGGAAEPQVRGEHPTKYWSCSMDSR
jgi:iron complex outermembrane receptor protein